MATQEEVKSFLKKLNEQIGIFGIRFRNDRGKNQELYNHISIVPNKRIEYIKELKVVDYSEGPVEDTLNGGADMWIFGKIIQGHEVYIKVQVLLEGAMCISFHLAEHQMTYPYKDQES